MRYAPSSPGKAVVPVSVKTILVSDPGPGEALVQGQSCGVCHTDLHYRQGGINDVIPFLGHEAAGVAKASPTRDSEPACHVRQLPVM